MDPPHLHHSNLAIHENQIKRRLRLPQIHGLHAIIGQHALIPSLGQISHGDL